MNGCNGFRLNEDGQAIVIQSNHINFGDKNLRMFNHLLFAIVEMKNDWPKGAFIKSLTNNFEIHLKAPFRFRFAFQNNV